MPGTAVYCIDTEATEGKKMALCPYCHDEKFMFAPVCTNCNHPTPLLFQLKWSFVATTLPLVLFVGFFWVLGKLFF